jgi:mRNA-degrading endonuclease RelE of RelBE toxin-antitoxin system
MLYNVFLPEFFKRIVKDLEKKYPNVKADLKTALRVVENNPELGKSFQGWGDVKKLRVQNSDVRKGKRSGYRLIYLVDHAERRIIPLLLYSKSHKSDVTAKELRMLLARLDQELSD